MRTNSNYEVNKATITIEEMYQTIISNHRNVSAKAISTITKQFHTLVKFMDIYLDRDSKEILALPVTAVSNSLISEYRYYLQNELCLSDSAVNTAIRFIKSFKSAVLVKGV